MKREFVTLVMALSLGFSAQSASITDLLKLFADYNAAKTLTAVTDMAGEANVGMEAFRSSGLKGSLYTTGYGVNLVNESSTLTRKMRVEGFYNGNFDLTLNYNGVFSPDSYELTARTLKPDGTAVDYPGATATLTPCLVLLDMIYVPVTQLPLMGYVSSADETGLDNLCFNALVVDDAAEFLLDYIPQETLVALIKAAINEQVTDSNIQKLLGTILDNLITEDSDELYLQLLDDAKINALKLTITKADGTTESETFDGYELHSIAATATATDRVATTVRYNSIYNSGYATAGDADATRTYRIAAQTDSTGSLRIYNFNNRGLAIHTSLRTDTIVNDSTGAVSTNIVYHTALQPVMGEADFSGEGVVRLNALQQVGCSPSFVSSLAGGMLSTLGVKLLTEASLSGTRLKPVWSGTTIGSTLTPGVPSHQGSNRWASSTQGALATTSNSVAVLLNSYLEQNANYSYLAGTVSLRTFSAPVVYDTRFTIATGDTGTDVTHDVALCLDAYRMSEPASTFGSEGIWLKGSFAPGDHTDFVMGYDLLILPQEVANVSKPYGSTLSNPTSLYKLDDTSGLQYRYSKNWTSYSSWLSPLLLDATYDVTAGADTAGLAFEKFVPYAAMTKQVASGTLLVKWSDAVPTSADTYTLFVRTRYTSESGLAPTYHALQVIDITGESALAAVDGVHVDSLRVYAEAGVVVVRGADPAATVTLLSAGGATLATAQGDCRIPASAGFYMVRVDGQTVKVLVK